MLDLIETSNRDIMYMLLWVYAFGVLSGVVLFYVPLKTKWDTLNRKLDWDIGHDPKTGINLRMKRRIDQVAKDYPE